MEKKNSILETKEIVKKYGKRTVVKGVTLKVEQGKIIGLLGPNGAGKTTSFYMITGIIRPNSGNIYLDGQDITKLPMYKRARMGIAYLPQEASIFRKMTVRQNLEAILEAIGKGRKERREIADRLLEEFGITHIENNYGYNLSGGERRRTEIARTLTTNPKFILFDEPFAGVDPIAVEDIQAIIKKLRERNIGILITDHNVRETLSVTDYTYMLYDGKIFKSGKAAELAEDPEAKKFYLGENFKLH
jgi:lipopolysaccharide export system ATP-binding protein